jgi:hypothetical protein
MSSSSELIDHRSSDERSDDDDEKVTSTTTAAAARIERTLLLDVEVSGTSDDLRVNLSLLNLLSGLNAALFLERVTVGGAVAGGEAVSLLRTMAGEYNFNS